MEGMRLPLTIHPQRFLSLLLAWILLLSCSWLPLPTGATPSPPGAPKQTNAEATQASSQAVPGTETVTPGIEETSTTELDPLDRLLSMRSIKFNLTSLKWDGSSRSIDVEIDSAGNMHVKHSPPNIDPGLLPEGFDPKMLPPSHELYVVDGKAYLFSDQNPGWMTTPVDENYIQRLAQEMHGPDGPALWLDMLPVGSIHAAGKDNVGGFGADKYTVNGQVDGQSIRGTIWFEPQADALVQAELYIPAALFGPADKLQQGEVKITLNAQKADIPLVSLPAAATDQPAAAATPTAGSTAADLGSLTVENHYTLQAAKGDIGFSLTAGPGKVWVGTGTGTILEVDSKSGTFGQSISLKPGAGTGTTNIYPIIKLGFDGQNIWALEGFTGHGADHLFAIDPASGAIAHQWDLTQWNLQRDPDSRGTAFDFGFSPGKLWVKDQIIDTHTFAAKYVGFLGEPLYAYNGKGWMWMTGVGPEACDDLAFINTDNTSQDRNQCRYPFLNHAKEGYSNVGDNSPLVLAGDRVWITGGWVGAKPTYTLEAFPADVDQLMKETKPLVSVPLMDNSRIVKMLFAGNSLWLLWTLGDKPGFLYQLDPQTGATLNSLDLVKAQTWDKSGVPINNDLPIDIATEGDNLWILTKFQLLRIKMP